jgi:O-antigen/teichoic acid export membrane protein
MYVLILNLGIILSFQTDSLIIGAFLDVNQIPFYSVANSFLVYLIEFVLAIAAVVMPMATKLKTEDRTLELREMFLKWSKICYSITLFFGLFLIILGPRFIGWWISPSFEGPAGEVLQILMISGLVFLPVRGVAQPILIGLGKVRGPTVAFLVAGALNLLLSVLLVTPFGLAGVAIGTAVPTGLWGLVILLFACRVLGVPLVSYMRYVVLRASVGAIPLLALLICFRVEFEIQGPIGFLGSGLATVLSFAFIWVFFVYRNDPYMNLVGRLTRLWK